MIIPINLSPPVNRVPTPLEPVLAKLGSNEVVLIELQGWLDVVEGEKPDGFIGTLSIENDKPVLRIGHHLLEGKIFSLSKPLAVLARAEREEAIGETSCYDIISIVKRKITFAKRPVPIIKAG